MLMAGSIFNCTCCVLFHETSPGALGWYSFDAGSCIKSGVNRVRLSRPADMWTTPHQAHCSSRHLAGNLKTYGTSGCTHPSQVLGESCRQRSRGGKQPRSARRRIKGRARLCRRSAPPLPSGCSSQRSSENFYAQRIRLDAEAMADSCIHDVLSDVQSFEFLSCLPCYDHVAGQAVSCIWARTFSRTSSPLFVYE